MVYIGVYKAIYSFTATEPDQLSIEENDILYVMEKSDVDDWWNVKKRIVGSDIEEPSGLVPSTYIEPASIIGSATALYDYTSQTDEEIAFNEGDTFNVYDTTDGDWLLVSDASQIQFGFVPTNYVDMSTSTAPVSGIPPPPALISGPAKAEVAQPVLSPAQSFAPPSVRYDQVERQQATKVAAPSSPTYPSYNPNDTYADDYDEQEEQAPAKPKRPNGNSSRSRNSRPEPSRERITNDDVPRIDDTRSNRRGDTQLPTDIYTWQVAEIEGKKKKKLTFGIGNGKIYFNPEQPSDDDPRSWTVERLISFASEKKHVFLDFKSPSASIELHVGSKDIAREILTLLGEISGGVSSGPLDEIKAASRPTSHGYRTGQVLYDFVAQNKDELNTKEGDLVYIVNDKKSPDWWLVENIDTGKRGVIPSTYVDTGNDSNFSLGSLGKMTKNTFKSKKAKQREADERLAVEKEKRKTREEERERERKHKEKEQRNRQREKDPSQRRRREENNGSSNKSTSSGKAKSKPNPKKIRTWVDRSGSFKVEAEFLGAVEGNVHLHKSNGVKIAVAANKLSLEDIEYIERVTGFSLDRYKPKSKQKQKMSYSDSVRKPRSSRSTTPKQTNAKPEYDWFEFFLTCGVDLNKCQLYTGNFEREQLDESTLPDIDASLLRNLGVREGDIIRVMKYLDNRFNRTKPEEAAPVPNARPAEKPISASALHGNEDDDAWVIKKASTQVPAPQALAPAPVEAKPRISGSLQDLVDLKPLDANYVASSGNTNEVKDLTAVPALPPNKTNTSIQLGQQKTGNSLTNFLLNNQKTGSMVAQKTGSSIKSSIQPQHTQQPLDPFKTGGTNILPSLTGGILPIYTGSANVVPVMTGGVSNIVPVMTGGMVPVLIPTTTTTTTKNGNTIMQSTTTGGAIPMTTFGTTGPLATFPTGGVAPIATFPTGGVAPIATFPTGGVAPIATFPTGGVAPIATFPTGGVAPIATFPTGGVAPIATFPTGAVAAIASFPTGGFSNNVLQPQKPQMASSFMQQVGGIPINSFGAPTNAFGAPMTSFGTGTAPMTSFGTGAVPMNSFGTGAVPMNSFGTGTAPMNSFGTGTAPMNSFGTGTAPMNSFGTGTAPMTSFGTNSASMNSFGAGATNSLSEGINNLNLIHNMQQQQQQQQQQQNMFQQNNIFDHSAGNYLTAQPTGFGFGNSPASPTDPRLSKANADNPFGF